MIKLITKEDFMPNFQKSIHYISWTPFNPRSVTGYSSMDFVDYIVRQNTGVSNPEYLYREIDSKNETGTLYPKANITIMPSYNQPYEDQEIYKHFNDAMKVQIQYIKADYIIFDMRNYEYISPYRNVPDNLEYMRMIDYNITRINILMNKNTEVYIVCLDKFPDTYFVQVASDKDIEKLS